MIELMTKFSWAFIVLYVLIGITAAIVLGLCFYFAVNSAIDRYQGWARRRKPMASRMSKDEILRARQRKAAGRKAQVMDAGLRVSNMPYEWKNPR